MTENLTISPNMSPLQLVSSGDIPARDLSEGVGETGGLELVLPNLMTRPGTTGLMEDKENLKPPSADRTSAAVLLQVVVVVEGEQVLLLLVPLFAALDWGIPFFRAGPPLCSW